LLFNQSEKSAFFRTKEVSFNREAVKGSTWLRVGDLGNQLRGRAILASIYILKMLISQGIQLSYLENHIS